MSDQPARRTVAGLSVLVVLLATVVVLGLGVATKASCASGQWTDGRQYRQLCYTDIVPLFGTEHLQGGRLPFLDPCPASGGQQCDEYPVLTMYLMRAAAVMGSYQSFFYANVLLLALCAVGAVWALYRMVGERALYVALAPTLLIYAFVNWDMLAVLLATLGTLAYLRERDGWSGMLLGLGAAAKFYPALLVVPFVIGRLRDRRTGGATTLAVWAAVAYGAVNLPFVMVARHAWATFFRYNSDRVVDWDSLWFVACTRLHRSGGCSWSPHLIDALSALAFVVVCAGLWLLRWRRRPDFPAWTFGFPLLVVFLLTNKVYSPQYGLWLLPWFALALPNAGLFVAFEVADVAVFVTRFSWFGRLSANVGDPAFAGFSGVPLGGFQVALVLRAIVLLVCLVAWVRRAEAEPVPAAGGGREGLSSPRRLTVPGPGSAGRR